jgi:Ca2+/Na+ antiporter
MENIFRILALALMFAVVIIKDISYQMIFKDSLVQLYLAIFVILILLVVDNVTGFILALSLLILYFKIYNNELKSKKSKEGSDDSNKKHLPPAKQEKQCILDKSGACMSEHYENVTDEKNKLKLSPSAQAVSEENRNNSNKTTLLPYITEEHLIAAQNNIVNVRDYENEILGIEKGLYNENVYGSQGFDNNNIHMKGYDEVTLGSLKYGFVE